MLTLLDGELANLSATEFKVAYYLFRDLHFGAGVHEPMLWTAQYGQGRVFVDALGNDSSAVTEQVFKVTFTVALSGPRQAM